MPYTAGACLKTRVDLFRDVHLRGKLTHDALFELGQTYPGLVPWGVGKTIHDANPTLPHHLLGCIPGFTKEDFIDEIRICPQS